MKLVIVESPTKAKTISKFLGPSYRVEASYGHVRDLPKSTLGIELENGFEPKYIIPVKAKKRVNQLKKEAKKAEKVVLATDEDREGEAIAWHLTQALGLEASGSKTQVPKVERIVFHEITKSAIEKALKHPREIRANLIDAQQARRVLDRLVGYKLSPFLWAKVARRLSAGRVQSAALRLIVQREEEVHSFKSEEYWTVHAELSQGGGDKEKFVADVFARDGVPYEKLGIQKKEGADEIVRALEKSRYVVEAVSKKRVRKNPPPPFTTSTMQQEAARKLHFSSKQTMRLAQELYEKGYITYMRTDSVHIAPEAASAACKWLNRNLGERYALKTPRVFKAKSKLAQEAHEAIRPTSIETPESGIETEYAGARKLYGLVWKRFVSSQMPQAEFDATTIEISATQKNNPSSFSLRAAGSVLVFDGFLRTLDAKTGENVLPETEKGAELALLGSEALQHFTEPPPRYNEASLIKVFEQHGIGRPSTYAPIISILQTRNYVIKNERKNFEPTEIGIMVDRVLAEHFPKIVDAQFTAHMEDSLDKIAEGEKRWQEIVAEFYAPFAENLAQKYEEVEKQEIQAETTNEVCEKCGGKMVVKFGRFGKFLACENFPKCRSTKSLNNSPAVQDNEGKAMACPKCKEGGVVRKRTRKGRFFFGCSRYPNCDFSSWTKPESEPTNGTQPSAK